MSWDSSDRRDRLPADWAKLVRAVKHRDQGRCRQRLPSGARCPRPGTEVDHIIPNDDHSLKNLRLLCSTHHGKKSSREGFQAREAVKQSKYRPREGHPGDVR